MTEGAPAALALTGIRKRFGALEALRDAHVRVRRSSVHALLGENGAGKTTLMRVAYGLLAPDDGTVEVQGRAQRLASPADAIAVGIGMVQQHFALVGAMTVAENVALGGHGRFDRRTAAARVREIGARTGLVLDPEARVDTLPVGAQQKLEIVKALARDAQVLILDEPTAVLTPDEARELLAWLRTFAAAGGAAVLITHRLQDALAMADDITVLRRGETVLTAAAAALDAPTLVGAMLGEALEPAAAAAPPSPGAPVLALEGVDVVDAHGVVRLQGATCTMAAGEIVGIAAVEGAGQHELLRVLAGRLAPTRGTVHRPDAVGFVPEDRHRDALLLDGTLTENVALRGAGTARGLLPWAAERRRTDTLLARFDVRAAGPDATARSLSGGNQQKLVLARELDPSPAALVVENPTRGLDIRASAAVLARLRAARDAGLAVVVHSGDLDEVLAVADRLLVVHAGRVREVPMHDREAIGRAMLGAEP